MTYSLSSSRERVLPNGTILVRQELAEGPWAARIVVNGDHSREECLRRPWAWCRKGHGGLCGPCPARERIV